MTSDAVQSQAGVGTAHLSPELTDDDKYTIHGVAIGAGDVTVGSSGVKKKWPADELRDAAKSLEGTPLVRDHKNNTDGTVGTVTKAHYRPGVGVVYEAELASHYEDLAQDIESGLLEVSARAYHAPTEELEEDDDSGALIVEDITFDNLSIVSQGASPSNSLNMGKATAMAQGPDGEAVAVMEAGGPRPEAAELRSEFGHGDDDDVNPAEILVNNEPDELASIDGMQIFGLVMWGDDQMGVISDFEEEDGDLMLQIDVVERENGQFTKTGDTVSKALHEVQMASEESHQSNMTESANEELQGTRIHTPEFQDTEDKEWSEPSLNDFQQVMDTDKSWDEMSEEQRSSISDHYIVSTAGDFPPENFGDLALPVVEPDGTLVLNALQNAKARAGQVSGVDGSDEEEINNIINNLANENFESANFGEDEESEDMGASSSRTIEIATLSDDDPETASTDGAAALEITDN